MICVRERMVVNILSADSETKMINVFAGGTSKIYNILLLQSAFIASAIQINMTL